MLEQVAIGRNDRAGAERYAEFRRRFQRAADHSPSEAAAPTQASAAKVPEFSIPTIEAQLDEPLTEIPAEPPPMEQISAPIPVESVVHEVDLSDEWAALSQQLDVAMQGAAQATVDDAPVAHPEATASALVVAPDESKEEVLAGPPAFDLELQPPATTGASQDEALSADSLLAELAAELESTTSFLGTPAGMGQHAAPPSAQSIAAEIAPPGDRTPANRAAAPAAPAGGGMGGPLGDLFEEFRSELGEMGKEDEDLETHYNLGIAYREMGLLEEAISEFQKVAKSADKGPAFRFGMQCCTLLGLLFMEKGQPAIAAIWYERALQTPGLDPESILALRYDLGVAQELAGDTAAAVKSFSQVYAMNIDYRDVAERISLLGKAR
jgi:tetratricopeptide (TPR) repeat protein